MEEKNLVWPSGQQDLVGSNSKQGFNSLLLDMDSSIFLRWAHELLASFVEVEVWYPGRRSRVCRAFVDMFRPELWWDFNITKSNNEPSSRSIEVRLAPEDFSTRLEVEYFSEVNICLDFEIFVYNDWSVLHHKKQFILVELVAIALVLFPNRQDHSALLWLVPLILGWVVRKLDCIASCLSFVLIVLIHKSHKLILHLLLLISQVFNYNRPSVVMISRYEKLVNFLLIRWHVVVEDESCLFLDWHMKVERSAFKTIVFAWQIINQRMWFCCRIRKWILIAK